MNQYIGPLIMFLLIVLLTIIYLKSSRYNKRLPLINVQATVLKKWVEQWRSSPNAAKVNDYYVEFDIDGQIVKVTIIKRQEFEKLNIGDKGVLSYQEKKIYKKLLVKFVKEV